jgi:hypothetical protein
MIQVHPVSGELQSLSTNQLRSVDGQQGLNLQLSLDASADFLELTDPDGTTTGPGSGTAGALRLGGFNLSNGGSSNFTTLTVDADGSDGIALEIPSSDNSFELNVSQLTVPDDPSSSNLDASVDAGRINFAGIDLTNTTFELTGKGDGLSIDGELPFINASTMNYTGDSSDDAILALEDVAISDFGNASSQYDFTGLEIDFDENGIAIVPPSQSFSLSSSGICLYDFSMSSCNSEDDERPMIETLEVDDLGFDGSTFLVGGTGSGLEFNGELKFSIDEITLNDDGTPNNSTDGEVIFNSIHFTSISSSSQVGFDDSGGAVSIESPAEFHVDGDEGVFLELPGFDTSGASFDNPANELYIQNMSVGGACSAGSPNGSACGDWSLRNVDMGGSWINVSGRN